MPKNDKYSNLAFANYIAAMIWGSEGIKVKDVFPINEEDWKKLPLEKDYPKKKEKK